MTEHLQHIEPYYSLFVRDTINDEWRIEFGDWDKGAVEFEYQDYRDHGHKVQNLKIERTQGKES